MFEWRRRREADKQARTEEAAEARLRALSQLHRMAADDVRRSERPDGAPPAAGEGAGEPEPEAER